MAKIIRTEGTPNPNALKFVVDQTLLLSGSRSFATSDEAKGDALAQPLFQIPGITSVFYMKDFITISKEPAQPWREVALQVNQVLPSLDLTPLAEAVKAAQEATGLGTLDAISPNDILVAINRVLDQDVRPGLAMDGGGLQVMGVDGHKVSVHYQGACGSCPSSTAGTLRYIDQVLKEKVHPELEVVPV